MAWVKFLHVLGMIVYVGGFMALTRLTGKAVKYESEVSRADAYRMYRRMHIFADWIGLAITIVCGLILLLVDPWDKNYLQQGYFHMKLTFFVGIMICDVIFTRMLFFRMRPDGPQPSKALFAALHGMAGLLLMGLLISIFVIRG